MQPNEHSVTASAASPLPRPTLDYKTPERVRPWWHGSAVDWLGSIALVLIAFVVTGLIVFGLAVFISYAMYL
jgi:hypothetical protein